MVILAQSLCNEKRDNIIFRQKIFFAPSGTDAGYRPQAGADLYIVCESTR